MRHEFLREDFFELEVLAPGTAGIAYDCQLRVGFRCGRIEGDVLAWCDGPEVEGFVAELASLGRELRGKATLTADDGKSLKLELSPVDSLGHFVLEVQVGATRIFYGSSRQLVAIGVFGLASSQLTEFCLGIERCIRSGVNTQPIIQADAYGAG